MSFTEKRLWVTMTATVVVWGCYYWRLVERIAAGGLADAGFIAGMARLFGSAVFLAVALEVGLTIFAAAVTSKAERDATDERERLSNLKASRAAMILLTTLVVTMAGAAYFAAFGVWEVGSALTGANVLVLTANAALACVVVSELFREGLTLAYLRRGV